MKKKRRYLLVALLLAGGWIGEPAHSQQFTASDGYVEFLSKAPLLEFRGTGEHLTGLIDLDENLVDFYVDLNTIDTGIEKRNRDMRNTYLETGKYPFAEFTGKLITPFDPNAAGIQEVRAAGTFRVHGKERQIEVDGTLERQGEGLKLEASWTLRLGDYDIERPGILFYELSEEQIVTISILLHQTGGS